MAPPPDARLRNVLARSVALRQLSAETIAGVEALRQRSRFLHRRFAGLHETSSGLLMRGLFQRRHPVEPPKPKSPLRLLA
jgi:hypothetical protein